MVEDFVTSRIRTAVLPRQLDCVESLTIYEYNRDNKNLTIILFYERLGRLVCVDLGSSGSSHDLEAL